MKQTVDELMSWRASPTPRVAVGINANAAYLARSDSVYRDDVWHCDLAYPDGQSVVWGSRLLGGCNSERVATTDLVHPLANALTENRSATFFLLGSRPVVVEQAARRLEELHPGLTTKSQHGYFGSDDEAEIVSQINACRPDALLVGLGDPVQQRWVRQHLPHLQVGIVITCGGLFDWLSGRHKRAPDWMIKLGLEWLWRVLIEPHRLLGRYAFGNTWFAARLANDLLRRKLSRG